MSTFAKSSFSRAFGVFLLTAVLGSRLAVAADLAPTGTLRAAWLGLNPVQGKVDPGTGKTTGVVADLAGEIARRLGVPLTLIPAPDAGQVIAHLKDGSADIGFLAFDPARGAQVDFSESYELMFNAYVVSAASPLRKSTDADRAGIRIAAVRGQTQQLFLSANMKNATVRVFETMPSQADLEKLLLGGEVDAFGVNRQRAQDAAIASGGKLRALQDNFLIVEQAIVVNKGDAAKLKRIDAILAELRASGFVKAAVDRSKFAGVAAK